MAAHIRQYQNFVNAVKNHRQPLVTADDGILNLATIDALYRSARQGHPVRVEFRYSQSTSAAVKHD